VRLPKVIFVKIERTADGTPELYADYHEENLVELSPVSIGEYHLVKTRRRKLVVEDA
jgi:hypothetical protein